MPTGTGCLTSFKNKGGKHKRKENTTQILNHTKNYFKKCNKIMHFNTVYYCDISYSTAQLWTAWQLIKTYYSAFNEIWRLLYHCTFPTSLNQKIRETAETSVFRWDHGCSIDCWRLNSLRSVIGRGWSYFIGFVHWRLYFDLWFDLCVLVQLKMKGFHPETDYNITCFGRSQIHSNDPLTASALPWWCYSPVKRWSQWFSI